MPRSLDHKLNMFRKAFIIAQNAKRSHGLLNNVWGRCANQSRSKSELAVAEWPLMFPTTATDMLRMFEDIPTSMFPSRTLASPSTPLLDIKETKDQYEYIVDAPGVKKEDVKVEVRDQMLNIVMHRKGKKETDTEQYHRVERFSGYMQRTVPLPRNALEDQISATYEDGVLHVKVPKQVTETQDENVKLIEVK